MTLFLSQFWWLLVAHAVCDFPLQGDFLAKGKNHRAPIPGVPWFCCLLAHALIHGGAVALLTGYIWLGIAETIVHALRDYRKGYGVDEFWEDQILHMIDKVVWAFLALVLSGKA